MPEQALDGIPLGLGLVVKINLLNFHVLRAGQYSNFSISIFVRQNIEVFDIIVIILISIRRIDPNVL